MGNAPGTTQLVNMPRSSDHPLSSVNSEGTSGFKYGVSHGSYQAGLPQSGSMDNCRNRNGVLEKLTLPHNSLSAGYSPIAVSLESSPLPVGSPTDTHPPPHVLMPTLYEHAITPPDSIVNPSRNVDMVRVAEHASSMSLDSPTKDEKDPLPSCFQETFNVDALAGRLHGTSLTEAIQKNVAEMENRLPCVFKWSSGGQEIFLVGSFNSWSTPIPMVKSDDCYYVIVKLWPGRHEYKFNVDGRWYHDPSQPTVCNEYGTLNNVVEVRPSDFNVMDALEADMMECQNRAYNRKSGTSTTSSRRLRSASGSNQMGSSNGTNRSRMLSQSDDEDYGQILPSAVVMAPPQLPQQLLQANLNSETSRVCDPNLLPAPHHVMVNHLYALSIKDGVIVLSCITRFRNKFVTTVYYKPI